jgi:hypothetical protein
MLTGCKRKDIFMMMDKTSRIKSTQLLKIKFLTIIFKEVLEAMVSDQLLGKRR